MNFLNHMEEWHVQASDRAESVVIAKVNHIYTMLYEPQKTFSKSHDQLAFYSKT